MQCNHASGTQSLPPHSYEVELFQDGESKGVRPFRASTLGQVRATGLQMRLICMEGAPSGGSSEGYATPSSKVLVQGLVQILPSQHLFPARLIADSALPHQPPQPGTRLLDLCGDGREQERAHGCACHCCHHCAG